MTVDACWVMRGSIVCACVCTCAGVMPLVMSLNPRRFCQMGVKECFFYCCWFVFNLGHLLHEIHFCQVDRKETAAYLQTSPVEN